MKSIEQLITLRRHFGSEVLQKAIVEPAVAKTKQAKMGNKRAVITERSRRLPSVYGWIEFPAWAAQLTQLRSGIESACRMAQECERHNDTIRLGNNCPNGRYSSLESMFITHLVPFDCGGDDPIDNIPWEGWWRPGYRRLMITEIASSGEKFVPIVDLQAVIKKNRGDALRDALVVLINKHECMPPTTLKESQAPAKL